MSLIELFLLAVGLSMDAFAVSVSKGLTLRKMEWKYALLCGAWFGAFQALMPAIGYLLGSRFSGVIGNFDHWIAFLLLALIGGNMIREAREEKDVEAGFGVKTMFLLAVATSIDALAAGVSFAFLNASLFAMVAFIGCVTFVISAAGVRLGGVFGSRFQTGAEIAGGAILILIGLKTLLEGLGILSL